MKITFERIVIVMLVFLLLGSFATCNMKLSDKEDEIALLQLGKQQSDSIVNVYGQKIMTQEAIITHDKEDLKKATDSFFHLKKEDDKKIKDVIAFYQGKTKTVIEKVNVPYVDTATTKKWEDSINQKCAEVIDYYENNTIAVPKDAIDSTADYYANLTATKAGIRINEMIVPDTQSIRFVEKKKNLWQTITFQRRKVEVQVLHSSKYILVTGQSSAIYVPAKKARWLEKVVLVGVGIYLGTKL